MTLAAGTKLGPYEVLSPLGAGGMGEVYRARDTKLNRDVAIKVLPESLARDADTLARFEREARSVAALNHPNILSIFDFGTHDGITYAVTELLEGETLREMLSGGALPVLLRVPFDPGEGKIAGPPSPLARPDRRGDGPPRGSAHRERGRESPQISPDGRWVKFFIKKPPSEA